MTHYSPGLNVERLQNIFMISKHFLNNIDLRITILIIIVILCVMTVGSTAILHPNFTTTDFEGSELESAMQSEILERFLIACGSIGLSLMVLYLYEGFSTLSTQNIGNSDWLELMPRILMVHSLPLSCAIIFFVAIPYDMPLLMLCTISIRCTCISYGVLMRLFEIGGDVFQSKYTVFALLFTCLSRFMTPAQFIFDLNHELASFLSIAFEVLTIVNISIVILPILKPIITDYNKGNLSSNELERNFYLFSIALLGCFEINSSIFFSFAIGLHTSADWFVGYFLMETLFSFVITVIPASIQRNDALNIQKKLLESKRTFVRFISHEVRNPLNTATLSLDILEDAMDRGNASEECFQILLGIRDSCASAVTILNESLDYDKLETGIMVLDKTIFSAWKFLQEAVSSFEHQALSLGIKMPAIIIENNQLQLQYQHHTNSAEINSVEDQVEGQIQDGIIPITHTTSSDNNGDNNNDSNNNDNNYNNKINNDNDNDNDEIYRVMLQADMHRLLQVVRNLISNALKFTPRGGTVSVKASIVTKNGNDVDTGYKWFRIQVIDTGAGIAEENQKKLFKQIIQFNPSKLQNGGGSGFGLWISNSIMDLHEGHISVYSQGEGFGSTFTVDLPIDHIVDPGSKVEPLSSIFGRNNNNSSNSNNFNNNNNMNMDTTALSWNKLSNRIVPEVIISNVPSEEKRPEELTMNKNNKNTVNINTNYQRRNSTLIFNLKVLVVDDSPMNRKLLCRSIQTRTGRNVYEAIDGQDAIEKLTTSMAAGETPFDLITMDFEMPIMNGATTSQMMRELGYKGLILGITGNGMKSDMDNFINKGADQVLTKPLTLAMIDQTIQDLLKKDGRSLSNGGESLL